MRGAVGISVLGCVVSSSRRWSGDCPKFVFAYQARVVSYTLSSCGKLLEFLACPHNLVLYVEPSLWGCGHPKSGFYLRISSSSSSSTPSNIWYASAWIGFTTMNMGTLSLESEIYIFFLPFRIDIRSFLQSCLTFPCLSHGLLSNNFQDPHIVSMVRTTRVMGNSWPLIFMFIVLMIPLGTIVRLSTILMLNGIGSHESPNS